MQSYKAFRQYNINNDFYQILLTLFYTYYWGDFMDNTKRSKIKLIIYIIFAVTLIIVLSLGITLTIKFSNDTGKINISASDVDMTVSAKIVGMKDAPNLPNITINQESYKEQGWDNISLEFEDKNTKIEIVITITNNYIKPLQVIFENNTTLNNLLKEEECFYNNNQAEVFPVEERMVIEQGKCLSYKVIFEIKDSSKSVNDKLALNFICASVI